MHESLCPGVGPESNPFLLCDDCLDVQRRIWRWAERIAALRVAEPVRQPRLSLLRWGGQPVNLRGALGRRLVQRYIAESVSRA